MTKIQCKNINVIPNKDIVKEAFCMGYNGQRGRLYMFYPEVIHNIARTTFLTYTQVYCISLVKTISTNWDRIQNIWFLSSCAKYTETETKRLLQR